MSSCASCTGRFPNLDLIKHSILPSFWSCSDGENAIGGGLLNASHDDADIDVDANINNDDGGSDSEGDDNIMFIGL